MTFLRKYFERVRSTNNEDMEQTDLVSYFTIPTKKTAFYSHPHLFIHEDTIHPSNFQCHVFQVI